MSRSPVTKFFTNKKFGCISLWISKVHAWNFISPSLFLFMSVRKKTPIALSHKITEFFSSYIIIYIYTYSWCAGQMSSSFLLFLPSLNLYAKLHFYFRLISSLKAGKVSNPNPLSTVHCTFFLETSGLFGGPTQTRNYTF